jgi:hypothetical protein
MGFVVNTSRARYAMTYARCILAGAVLAGGSACATVTVSEPVGENVVEIRPADWEGLWRMYPGGDVGFVMIQTLDPLGGVLRVTELDTDVGAEPEVRTAYLRESGGWMLASYQDDSTSDTGLGWMRVENTGDAIVLWFPDRDRFAELVRRGRLPGTVTENSNSGSVRVRLTELGPEHLELITSGTEGVLFDWEEPGMLIRISPWARGDGEPVREP